MDENKEIFPNIQNSTDTSTLNELVKLEISLIMEDLRAQIKSVNLEIENQRSVNSLTITAIGITIAASPFIVESQIPILFGIAPLFFYGLSLTQLRYVWTVIAIDGYINNTLIPDLKNAIKKFDTASNYEMDVFKWSKSEQREAYTKKLWQFPIEAARYLIPVVAGICCCLAYWFTSTHEIKLIDYVIIGLNIFWIIYIIFASLKTRSEFLSGKEKDD